MEIDFLRNILNETEREQCDLIYMEVYEMCVRNLCCILHISLAIMLLLNRLYLL